MEIVDVPGDGNCFYHAVSASIDGQISHQELREKTAELAKSIYQVKSDDSAVEAAHGFIRLSQLAMDGTWMSVDSAGLVAAVLGCPVYVCCVNLHDGSDRVVLCEPFNADNQKPVVILLDCKLQHFKMVRLTKNKLDILKRTILQDKESNREVYSGCVHNQAIGQKPNQVHKLRYALRVHKGRAFLANRPLKGSELQAYIGNHALQDLIYNIGTEEEP